MQEVMLAVAKIRFMMLSAVIAGACLLSGGGANASSWAYVPPEEVAERADVIVTGRFDFASGMPASQAPIFVGFVFDVERVYRGDVPRRMMVGVDGNGMTTWREFQEQGGSFLLLLEYRDRYDYPVTVAGPNGMVPLADGAVDETCSPGERYRFFTEFLKRESPAATYESNSFTSNLPALIGAGAGAVGMAAIAALLLAGKKRSA